MRVRAQTRATAPQALPPFPQADDGGAAEPVAAKGAARAICVQPPAIYDFIEMLDA